MKKIAFITSHAPSLINFRSHLILELVKQGWQVFGIAPNYDDDIRLKIRNLGAFPVDCSFSRTGLNPLRDILDLVRLAWLLHKLKLDLVICYFIKPVIYGTVAAWLARVPRRFAMIEGLGFVFNPSINKLSLRRKLLRSIVIALYRYSLKYAHRVIFLNRDDLAELVGLRVLPLERSYHLGGIGVDLDFWSQTMPVKDRITFILVARLLREKGVEVYVNAARIVKHNYPDARFFLLGGLDENPGSISVEEVDEWVRNGVIEWPGHVSTKPWLDNSSVFVLPSFYREGVPLSIQEAMSVGRAIITTDAPGCRETVEDGINGFLVPIRDSIALAKKMIFFMENPELIDLMGKASRVLALERFDVHKANAKIINLILDGFNEKH
jgi:glycosyltransferase involved in cell wall biosynthesis